MSPEKRRIGREFRNLRKLDRAWKASGKQEGRTENDLAFSLGRAIREGWATPAKTNRVRNGK